MGKKSRVSFGRSVVDLVRGFRSGAHVLGYLGVIHLGYTFLARIKNSCLWDRTCYLLLRFSTVSLFSMNLAFGVADKDRSLARATGRLNS